MDREAALRRISARQHSVFTRRQALEAGWSGDEIDRRLAAGIWIRIHPGVYMHAVAVVTWRSQLAAALLACGPSAIASHRAAATVWRFADDLFVPEVTIPIASRRRPSGVIVHRSCGLEVATHDAFRVTRPMRTVLDLAACLDEDRLAAVVDDAHRRGLLDPVRLRSYITETTRLNARGSGVLREIVGACCDEPNASTLESLFFSALRRARLPLPTPQHPVRTRDGLKYIDYAYPEAMIAIELDSWEHHGSREAFEADRARGNEIELLGWRVLHFTWRALRSNPTGVASTVGETLGYVPTRWRRR